MAFLPPKVMVDILLKVEAEDPIPLGLLAIFDLLNNTSDQYATFKDQYITNNLVRCQENGLDVREIRRVVDAFEEVQRLWDDVEKLCYEEKEKNEADFRIGILNHMLVAVIYMKDNFNFMRDIMQNVVDRIRCLIKCLEIYLNA